MKDFTQNWNGRWSTPPPSTPCNKLNLGIFGGSTVGDDEYVQLITQMFDGKADGER